MLHWNNSEESKMFAMLDTNIEPSMAACKQKIIASFLAALPIQLVLFEEHTVPPMHYRQPSLDSHIDSRVIYQRGTAVTFSIILLRAPYSRRCLLSEFLPTNATSMVMSHRLAIPCNEHARKR